jgi:tRNA-specific 2-thiouridylase
MKGKVVIGLSGGIDSSMAALLLKNQGYEVIGLHFSFEEDKYPQRVLDIAQRLDIPVVVQNISKDFSLVKNHFAAEYLKGRTPSPCTFCNKIIKWKKLNDFANANNCDFISSGHYINKILYNGYYHLQKGIDPVKDQSYFLWELESHIIERMLTPLGNLTKAQVKNLAAENGFTDIAKSNESMGICFLHNLDYREFLKINLPEETKRIKSGQVKNETNKVVGKHNGYLYYTVGQKRDLFLDIPREAYVSSIDPINNEITIGTKESLNQSHILLKDINLINPQSLKTNSKVSVNIRGYGLNPQKPAIIKNISDDAIEIKLESPAWAVAPGQPVVFYKEDIVLGGGIAEKSW